MPLARFDGNELNAWRKRRGLLVRELAWVHGIPIGTLEDKLTDRYPPRLDTERIIDMVDLALARGYPPPGWPLRLCRNIWNAEDPEIDQMPGFQPSISGEKP